MPLLPTTWDITGAFFLEACKRNVMIIWYLGDATEDLRIGVMHHSCFPLRVAPSS
jgi:hypothetical protein